MLARQHRFHGYTSLSAVYRRGTTARNQQLALRYLHNRSRKDYRMAVIVSRKIHKSAVKRNRVRRRIYEIVRQQAHIAEPYDMIFSVFSEQIIDLSPTELSRMVLKLLQKAHIHNGEAKPASAARDIVDAREENH